MIDLHTHTLLSDGVLLPSELVRRARVKGYKAIALTDHVDSSNIDFVIPRILTVCKNLNRRYSDIYVIAGVEITHVPPRDFKKMVAYSRNNGAQLVIIHGETLAEPVIPGTNMAALDCNIDILAHPGLITLFEAKKAALRKIYLEITARSGHSITNGHVAQTAIKAKAQLILNTDTHEPKNLITNAEAEKICLGAGLDLRQARQVQNNAKTIVKKIKTGGRYA